MEWRMRRVLLLLLGLLFVLAACAPQGRYTDVSVDDLYAHLNDPSVYIVDVRTPGEFAAGHVAGAVNRPLQEIDRWWRELPKDRPVYVYCRSGNRSRQASEYLKRKGFTNIYNVTGGILDWQAAGYPLVR